MKAIYKFYVDCYRQGELSGIFVAEESAVAELLANEETMYLSDVLGKHSQITVTFKKDDEEPKIFLVTNDPMAVELFEKYNMAVGYNPFNHI
jgi:hypothetical protein